MKAYNLRLKIVSASMKVSSKDTEATVKNDKKDPFCQVVNGKSIFQTKSHLESGKKPVWEEAFTFSVMEDKLVKFSIHDENDVSEKKVEEAKAKLGPKFNHQEFRLQNSVGLATGELDLNEYLNKDQEVEVKMMSPPGADGKSESLGKLKLELQWQGDFTYVGFNMKINIKQIDFTGSEIKASHDKVHYALQIGNEIIRRDSAAASVVKKVANISDSVNKFFTVEDEILLKVFDSQKPGLGEELGGVIISIDEIKTWKSETSKTYNIFQSNKKACSVIVGFEHDYMEKYLEYKKKTESAGQKLDQNLVVPNTDKNQENGAALKSSRIGSSRLFMSVLPKNKKVKLSVMPQEEKEVYLKEQQETLQKLREHNESLKVYLTMLTSKHQETMAVMKDKKNKKPEVTEEEQHIKGEIVSSMKSLKTLQKKSNQLKNKLSGESAYDKLQTLENQNVKKDREIERIQKEINYLDKLIDSNQKTVIRHSKEKGYEERYKQINTENQAAREKLKATQLEVKKATDKTIKFNTVAVEIEKVYRNMCLKHNIDDTLNLKIDPDQQTINMKDFNPVPLKRVTKPKIPKDNRMNNPIFKAIYQSKKEKKDPDDERLAKLEMSEANFKVLLDEWRTILQNQTDSKSGVKTQNQELLAKEKDLAILRNQLEKKDAMCKLINQKIKQMKHIKTMNSRKQEQIQEQKKKNVQEEWDSKFNNTESELHGKKAAERISSSKKAKNLDKSPAKNLNESIRKDQKQDSEKESSAITESPMASEDEDKKDEFDDPANTSQTKKEFELGPRTEITLGQRYNKPFEVLFDDQMALDGLEPRQIVRIKVHHDGKFIVGLQNQYITTEGEMTKTKLNGNRRVNSDNLMVQDIEVYLDERLERFEFCYSKGLHWVKIHTSKSRELRLGPAIKCPKKGVEGEVKVAADEHISHLSGGYSGKSYKFTYLAFHVTKKESNQNLAHSQLIDTSKPQISDAQKPLEKPANLTTVEPTKPALQTKPAQDATKPVTESNPQTNPLKPSEQTKPDTSKVNPQEQKAPTDKNLTTPVANGNQANPQTIPPVQKPNEENKPAQNVTPAIAQPEIKPVTQEIKKEAPEQEEF